MRTMKHFLLTSIFLATIGCSISSKNMVGLENYRLDSQKINGAWIDVKTDSKGFVVLNVISEDEGIVSASIFENEKKQPRVFKIKIMKGKSLLYYNVLPEEYWPEKDYFWGRVQLVNNKITAWEPSDKAFIKAIEAKKIIGDINPPILTDTAINIIDLVESSESQFFRLEKPISLIKSAK